MGRRRGRGVASPRWARPRRRATLGRGERGAVTAETAMVLPLLVSLTIALVWVLSLGVAQVRAVDAARETARSLARGDAESLAVSLGRQVAPEGASIAVSHSGSQVSVEVTTEVEGPGGLVGRFGGLTVSAEAVAAQEQQ